MKRLSLLSLITVFLLAACASSGAPRHDDGLANGSEKLARYQPYVSEPVSQFNMYSSFDGWSEVDNEHVLIHTNVNETYLLTVAPVCINLPFATRIGVQSRFPNTVSSGFDSIRVGRDTCRILEIRPVNYKKMQADLRAQKKLKAANKG